MFATHRLRVATVALTAATGMLLTACSGGSGGGNSKSSSAPPKSTTISGTVTMAEPGDNPGDLALRKKLAANFMKLHPGVTVKFTIVPGTSYDQKIQTMIAGGKAPDIFGSGDVQIPNIVAKKFALNLTPLVKRDKYDLSEFYPAIVQNLTYNGQLVGLTDNYDTEVMYYNTTLFKKAGVAPPTAAWTWADFTAAAQKLTSGSGSNKTYGALYDSWFAPVYDQIWSDGGNPFLSNGTCGYDSPAAVKAFTEIQNLYKQGVAPLPSAFSENGSEQAFLKGNIGMMIGNGRWSAYTFKDVKKFGWKIAPLPLGSSGRANFFHIGMFAIARQSKNPNAALEFLKYLVSKEGITAGLADMQGIPSRPAIAESDAFKNTPFNNAHNTVTPFIESLKTVHRAPLLTNFNQVNDTVTAKISPIWTLKGTPTQVLPTIVSTVTPMLGSAGAVGGG